MSCECDGLKTVITDVTLGCLFAVILVSLLMSWCSVPTVLYYVVTGLTFLALFLASPLIYAIGCGRWVTAECKQVHDVVSIVYFAHFVFVVLSSILVLWLCGRNGRFSRLQSVFFTCVFLLKAGVLLSLVLLLWNLRTATENLFYFSGLISLQVVSLFIWDVFNLFYGVSRIILLVDFTVAKDERALAGTEMSVLDKNSIAKKGDTVKEELSGDSEFDVLSFLDVETTASTAEEEEQEEDQLLLAE